MWESYSAHVQSGNYYSPIKKCYYETRLYVKTSFCYSRPQRQLHEKQRHTSWPKSTQWEQEQRAIVTCRERKSEADGMHGVTIPWGLLLDPHNNLMKLENHFKIPGSEQPQSSLMKVSPASKDLLSQQNAGH